MKQARLGGTLLCHEVMDSEEQKNTLSTRQVKIYADLLAAGLQGLHESELHDPLRPVHF